MLCMRFIESNDKLFILVVFVGGSFLYEGSLHSMQWSVPRKYPLTTNEVFIILYSSLFNYKLKVNKSIIYSEPITY